MSDSRPLILFIPGLLRSERHHAALLEAWRTKHDVVVWHLPGHLRPRASAPGIKPIISQLRKSVGQVLAGHDVLLVGESLGGLVAMLLAVNQPPPNLRGVIAFDPPLHPAGSEALHREIAALWRQNPHSEILHDYAGPVFGHPLGEPVESRDYRSLLRHRPAAPVHIVAGDGTDSVVGEVVRQMIAASPGYTLHETTGRVGHDILGDAPEQATAVINATLMGLRALHDA